MDKLKQTFLVLKDIFVNTSELKHLFDQDFSKWLKAFGNRTPEISHRKFYLWVRGQILLKREDLSLQDREQIRLILSMIE